MNIFVLAVFYVCIICGTSIPTKPATTVPTWTTNNPSENPNLVEGDMVFTVDGSNGRGVAMRGASVRWPNGIVPYEISSTYGPNITAFIVDTMRKMEQLIAINNATCISFRPKTVSDTVYISIGNGSGCSSPVGMGSPTAGARSVSLAHPGCIYEATIMHELLHSLGFYHEQSRPDRDEYVRVNYGNIQTGMEHNFDKYGNAAVDTQNTPYDYGSVMHYGTTYFTSNGQPTMEPLQPGISIGQRVNLSAIDIFEARLFYNCSGGGVTVTRPTTSATPNIYIVNTTVSSSLTPSSRSFTRYSTSTSGCYFEALRVTVSTAGIYVFTAQSSMDTFGYMYANGFDSNDTGSNLFTYDDDGAGSGEFQMTMSLQPNFIYYLVVTTFNANITGAYTIVASGAAPVNLILTTNTAAIVYPTISTNYSSALTNTSLRFNRTGAGSLSYYEAIPFNVSNNGDYTFRSNNVVDTYGYLYAYNFTPNALSTYLLIENDDFNGSNQFQFTYGLLMGYRYILVFTTFAGNTQTPITVAAWGPGIVFFPGVVSPATTTTTTTTNPPGTTTTTPPGTTTTPPPGTTTTPPPGTTTTPPPGTTTTPPPGTTTTPPPGTTTTTTPPRTTTTTTTTAVSGNGTSTTTSIGTTGRSTTISSTSRNSPRNILISSVVLFFNFILFFGVGQIH